MNMRAWHVATAGAVWLLATTPAAAQLRVVQYNVTASGSTSSGPREGMATVFGGIADSARAGFTGDIDILLLQEGEKTATTGASFAALLNQLTGKTTYTHTLVDGATTGSGRPMAVYDAATVTLRGEQAIGTTSTSGQARQALRYTFAPAGYSSAADFTVYVSHMKASTGTTNAARRDVEAQALRADADALGQGRHVIYAGDLNLYNASEAAFQTLTAAGAGQAFDPASRVGNWNGASSFRDVHTQSPASTAAFPGQVTGGMDNRFDFQLVTGEWLDGHGLDYVSGSYWAFGNTASHALNGAITTGSAATLQGLLPGYTLTQAQTVLADLARASDHLPVVADYRIPAKMDVSVAAVPATVIVGASVDQSFTVTNAAPVRVVGGSERLDYTFVGTGALSGTGGGADQPLGGGTVHALRFDTTLAGSVSGTVAVAATTPGADAASFARTLALSVLDPARPSFDPLGNVTTVEIDFGRLDQGAATGVRTLTLANRAGALGASWTAGLDLDAIVATQSAGLFSTTLSTFSGLAAGLSRSFDVRMATDTVGDFTGQYRLDVSDVDLPGAVSRSLLVTLRGSVTAVPEPSTLALLAIALGCGRWWLHRRSA
jgi:endonuclease/exonuclease/phosphatase family metal-dependent hydrolase